MLANTSDIEILGWLAECQRNRNVAVAIPADVRRALSKSPVAWAKGLCYLDRPLKYEPRSLAVSANGQRIAIGTKAGAVHLAHCDGDNWRVDDGQTLEPVLTSDNGNRSQTRVIYRPAIRGLCFLGNDLLVVGRGPGFFTIIDLSGAPIAKPVLDDRGLDRLKEDPWLLRFVKIIPLFSNSEVPSASGARIALGLTQGSTLHVLSRLDGESFEATSLSPKSLFGDSLGRDSRLVDGEWWGHRLLLLDSGQVAPRAEYIPPNVPLPKREGRIHQFRRSENEILGFEPEFAPVRVPYWRPRSNPRSISACHSGVGIQFGEDVTFLPWIALESGGEDHGVSPWVEVPGATRSLAVQEFDTRDWAYLAVATEDAGVRWIPWRYTDRKWQPWDRGGQRSFSGVLAAILEIALARQGSESQKVYLILASRNHRLRIASLLDKDKVHNHLEDRIDPKTKKELLTSETLPSLIQAEMGRERKGFLERAPRGVVLRLIRMMITERYEAAYATDRESRVASPLSGVEISGLFVRLEMADLAEVVRWLRLSWTRAYQKCDAEGESAESAPPSAETRVNLFRQFCLWAFQRTARLDEGELRDLARFTLESIEDLRRDLPSEECGSLGLFGGFLRKWFEYGHTYGENDQELVEFLAWNDACNRDLDAIFYLTRLLRRRVDVSWQRRVETTDVDPGIWDLGAPSGAPFFLHSHTDGRIFATAHDGRPVQWELEEAKASQIQEVLDRGAITRVDQHLALCHAEAKDFRARYRHGPYARSLYVEPLHASSFLVFFGIRGWHPADLANCNAREQQLRRPRLVALVLEWNDDEKWPSLMIRDIAITITHFEPYAITRLPLENTIELVVGTGGASSFPFVQARVHWQEPLPHDQEGADSWDTPHTSRLALSVRSEIQIKEDLRWRSIEFFPQPPEHSPERMPRLAQGSNPCWSAQAFKAFDAVWLWIGMQDGRLRSFLWDTEDGWTEGGRWRRDDEGKETRPLLDPILTYSPVRKLRYLKSPLPSDRIPLLAYGTAEGVVGVVSLDRLHQAQIQPAPRKLGGAETEPDEPWIHLLHTRQKSAICGLADYKDGKDWNLAVLTEWGRVAIFNLAPGTADAHSVLHRGLRLDHFLLYSGDRALRGRALLAFSFPERRYWDILQIDRTDGPFHDEDQQKAGDLPVLMIGGDNGTLTRQVLAFPKFSPRRSRRAIPKLKELFKRQTKEEALKSDSDDPYLARSVHSENVHPWLRLASVGGKNLLRFSLWYELHKLRESHFPSTFSPYPVDVLANADIYLKTLSKLTDEVYGRKPFEMEAAKILWSETAGYVNRVAEISIAPSSSETICDQALAAFRKLLVETDNLSNRWIGADLSVEARVLMHSFGELLDWPSIILLASDDSRESFQETRELLLFKSLQHRLRHNDILVPLETLRTLNTAILRVLIKKDTNLAVKSWRLVHRPSRGGLGFHDLMTLVGNLARQQAGRLTPADPLYTEIAQFFALSILLIPDGILLVGRVVSESRLAEHGTDVGRRILLHARMFKEQLAQDFNVTLAASSAEPIERFEDYLSRDVDISIKADDELGSKSSWRRLLSAPWEPTAPVLTDRHYLAEQRKVLFTVARLAHLTPVIGDKETFRWLVEEEILHYFADSRAYLRWLMEKRAELIAMLEHPKSTDHPTQLCDEEIRRLDEQYNLFEPRRSHYRSILDHWRRRVGQLAEEALPLRDLVKLIDRFNRHVYRTSADDLMASLTELALRSAPIAFAYPAPAGGEIPLRLQIQEAIRPHRFTSELFRRGSLLVQGSHLATTLLHLSRRCLNIIDPMQGRLSTPSFMLSRIREKAEEIAALEGVDLRFYPENLDVTMPSGKKALEELVPGDELIWSTILHEIARNVYDYCRTDAAEIPKFHLRWHSSGPSLYLAAGGDRPFYDTLNEIVRPSSATAEALLKKVRDITGNPGTRYQTEPKGSFGFGLYFLKNLFDLLDDASAELKLLHPEQLDTYPELDNATVLSFGDLKILPLTMIFSWRSRT